ncbi:MAG: hypothetical protein HQL18_03940 [Candidatus Omnitrophica bacterium]|nr:hypothetical protein [Candidatus Omnitrophota bacterium]
MKTWPLPVVVFFLLIEAAPVHASDFTVSCVRLTAQVVGRDREEQKVDSCIGLTECTRRDDGTSVRSLPMTHVKVIRTSGDEACPGEGAELKVSGRIFVDRVTATLESGTVDGPNGPVSMMRLTNILSMEGMRLPGLIDAPVEIGTGAN